MIGKEEKMKAINVFVTILLVSVVLGLLVGVSGATWCDTDFAKRVNVSVNNTNGAALTDYQVYVNLSSNPINETSLRVYNSTSCTLRPHWTENETGGNSYGVWINYSSIAASTWANNTAIYYDNPSASSASDGTNTFEFFDDFETEDEEWEKYSGNPVLNASSGSERFDSGYIFNPEVTKVGSEYWMYYTGGLAPNVNKRDNIGLAKSTDLNNWTKWDGDQTNQSIIYSGGVGDFDEDRAWGQGNVVRENATSWKIWYLGDSDTGGGHVGRVGYATSTNGENWTKYIGTGYGNSIFEDMSTSSKGICSVTILKESDTDYKMVYSSFTASYAGTDIRYATSTDGINWTIQNSGTPVISGDYYTADLINISGTYYLWGMNAALTNIILFTSTDLINWTNKGTQLSIGDTGEWDSTKLYWGRVFEDTPGVWRMFFNAHDSVNICIGYATLEKTLPIITSQWTTIDSPVDYNSTNDYWGGTHSMQIGVTNNRGITHGTLAASEDITISMRLKMTTSDYFMVLHGDSSTNMHIVFMTDLLQYYDAGWVGTHSAPHGNWYKLTMKDIDYAANTYDICLGDDETVIYDSVNMHGSGDYDGIIKIYNGDAPGIGYVDNVYVRKYAASEPSTTLGSEEQQAGGTTPVISNVQNGSINPTSQWINWTVNQSCSNRVKYWYTEEDSDEVSCSGVWDTTYLCAKTYDGNWSSYGFSPSTGYVYFNYTIPSNASRTLTKWYGKDQHVVAPDNMGYPYTIPLLCWNSPLRLRVEAFEGGAGQDHVSWQCYNGTGWEEIEKNLSYVHQVYEERMEWGLWSNWQNSTATPNITLSGLTASTQYWYQVWSYNTSNNSLSDNSSTLNFTTAAADSSFTVTLPSGYTHLKFEPSNSIAQNVTPNGQTDSQEFYNVTNTGDITLDIRLKLNETVSNIVLKADTDNNPLGAKEVNTTLVTIYSNLATTNSADIWLWSDFSHAVEQDTNKTINVNVTQSA